MRRALLGLARQLGLHRILHRKRSRYRDVAIPAIVARVPAFHQTHHCLGTVPSRPLPAVAATMARSMAGIADTGIRCVWSPKRWLVSWCECRGSRRARLALYPGARQRLRTAASRSFQETRHLVHRQQMSSRLPERQQCRTGQVYFGIRPDPSHVPGYNLLVRISIEYWFWRDGSGLSKANRSPNGPPDGC